MLHHVSLSPPSPFATPPFIIGHFVIMLGHRWVVLVYVVGEETGYSSQLEWTHRFTCRRNIMQESGGRVTAVDFVAISEQEFRASVGF